MTWSMEDCSQVHVGPWTISAVYDNQLASQSWEVGSRGRITRRTAFARSVDGDLSWTSRGRPSGASEWRG